MMTLPTRLVGDDFAVRTWSLEKRYGGTPALRGIDLTVLAGAVYVLVGPNGAGKTSARTGNNGGRKRRGGRRFLLWPRRTRTSVERDIDDELEFDFSMRERALIEQGLSAEEARRRARQEFGDVGATREYCLRLDERTERATRIARVVSELAQDTKHALRMLRRAPGSAAVLLLTLALGIGANTAVFSAVRAVLLRPLPYGEPASLVALHEHLEGDAGERLPLSAPNYVDYRARQRSFEDLAAYTAGTATWRPTQGDPEVVRVATVTENLFDVLGVPALYGRTFLAGDAIGGGQGVVVSHEFWRGALGADPAAASQRIVLNDRGYDVIGIMPPTFTLGLGEDLWLPTDLAEDLAAPTRARKQRYLNVIGRLAGGVSMAAARADMNALGTALQAEHPEANTGRRPLLMPLHVARTGELRAPLLLLQGAAALVLLIACANLANLTLARTLGRSHELAVRTALGSGRARLVRQLLTESIVVSLAGGAIGVAIAVFGTSALLGIHADVLPAMFSVRADGRVLLFALALSVVAGVAFGVLPAARAAVASVSGSMREGGRGATGGRSAKRIRNAFVVVQIGLAVVLLVGAGLLVQSFRHLTSVRSGFDPANVLTAQLGLGGSRYDAGTAVNRFYDGVLDALAASPGVVAAGAAIAVPLDGTVSSTISIDGEPFDPLRPPEIGYVIVRGDYFEALRVPLVAGRLFDDTDRPDGPRTVILNEAAVRRFFRNGDAVGRRVRFGPDQTGPWSTVIGVIGDVRDEALDVPARPAVYVNHRQETWFRSLAILVRTEGRPENAVPALRRAVRSQDPTLAVRDVATLEDVLGSSLAPRRFALALAGSFAGLALLLAALGIYGVLALGVSHRTRELGVRRALGATAPAVVTGVLQDGLRGSVAGIAIGVVGASAASRLLEGMLFGVTPLDIRIYAAAVVAAVLVVGAASIVPAVRATRVDPLTSMRAE